MVCLVLGASAVMMALIVGTGLLLTWILWRADQQQVAQIAPPPEAAAPVAPTAVAPPPPTAPSAPVPPTLVPPTKPKTNPAEAKRPQAAAKPQAGVDAP